MAGACGALYFINLKGDVLISRQYRDDVDKSLAEDVFKTQIAENKDKVEGPVINVAGVSFIWMRHSNVYLVLVTKNNANVMLAMKFLSQVVTLFKSYFGGKCDENAIKNNFVLIYELLDEIIDFGYPQVLDSMILKQYIFQEGFFSAALKDKNKDDQAKNATLQVTGAVGWRREGIRYKKNEVFLDVVEKVNLLMSSKGSVLRCDVVGQILMKCFLSGMPDLKLGLNDKLEDNSITFHPCVNLGRFSTERVVSFVPPDGEFELLKYRCQEGITLPFRVIPIIKEYGRTRIECNVKVKSTFNSKLFALNVVVRVPVPKYTAKANIQITAGKAKYDASKNELVWKIKRFTGQTEHNMSAEVELVATTAERAAWSKPPIKMDFQVPMYSASGLRVQYLKVWEKSSYKVDKWVRKISKSGDYDIRM
mmetsp:Transcript_26144/g.46495  ORF Transcript_26144/g.46495 Transcript_26144/m.46495 type:complete len:422 (-) Transcript_26144:15-1280(-)